MEIAPTLAPAVAEKPAALPGWEEVFHMPLFRPGTSVRLGDQWETVSHVALRRQELAIYLVGHEASVSPNRLFLQPSAFTTVRQR
ncbi:hypothetical protein [Paracidovorax valerianellae]|uniref:Uncharacterized protein n=1 Tax=Paracidovorax valerianellae TaxID=187868 RepID=A0A1G6JEU3_9BURK|nr:hypothetical protein [Paracidovorax valerianellae]MDA8445364.1 hypothetical protein [Paracidovorax valerianellae]SDC17362.1 hypothetical protein SAMN05192589_101390 [Paracidovorax valerianellae]